MIKKDEALKMALETAEGIANANWREWHELASSNEFERWVKSRASHMAAAIREALAEQPAQQQEPVAIVTGYYGGRLTVTPFNLSSTLPTGMALYTSPPANANAGKPWVGLDKHDLDEILDVDNLSWMATVTAIESKLKAKNSQ